MHTDSDPDFTTTVLQLLTSARPASRLFSTLRLSLWVDMRSATTTNVNYILRTSCGRLTVKSANCGEPVCVTVGFCRPGIWPRINDPDKANKQADRTRQFEVEIR